jgi:hypothetical protein
MKKLFFVVSALAALALLAPSTGFAQHEFSNQVGLYMSDDGTGATGTMTVGVPVNVYLVLTKPTDVENGEAPYFSVNFFDLMINFDPPGGLFKLADALPPKSINIGDTAHIDDGYLEYIVGIGEDHLLTGTESVWLIAFQFMAMVATPIDVSLGVCTAPSIEGEMTFMSISPNLRIMYNAAGAIDATVFSFNREDAVAVENASFGSVKALYR